MFDWQTEGDDWTDEPITPEPAPRPKKRPWRNLLLVLLALVAIAALLYRQVRQQIDAAVVRTENDIQATHELVLQAADRADRDLLTTFASGRNSEWFNQQLDVAAEGLLYNPHSLGFTLQKDNFPEYEFTLSPNLNEAEVYTTRSFTALSTGGVSETVRLKQLALYRRGEDRWLYSPPENALDFWQGTTTWEGQYLIVTYPQRDAEMAQLLSRYLHGKLFEMCHNLPDLRCPNGFRIYLKLETDPASQLDLLDVEALFSSDPDLSLPTLTLIGLPVDEAGTDALFRGYGTHVLRTAMTHLLDWECCQRGLLYRALLDYQLAELGLSAYPIHPADYEQLFSSFRPIHELSDLWNRHEVALSESGSWRWAYALAAFLLTTPVSEASAGEMQHTLLEANGYNSWLNDLVVSGSILIGFNVQQSWLNFIYNMSLSGRVVEGKPELTQNILLYCDFSSSQSFHHLLYDWTNERWQQQTDIDEPTWFMHAFPDDSAVVLQQGFLTGLLKTLIWQNGTTRLLFDGSEEQENAYYFVGQFSPDGRTMTMASINAEGYALLNLDQCSPGDCPLMNVRNWPYWSPDSSQILIEDQRSPEISGQPAGVVRLNSQGNQLNRIYEANAPFWFSNTEYGFTLSGRPNTLQYFSIDKREMGLLFSAETLREALNEEDRPAVLDIWRAVPNPADPDILVIQAHSGDTFFGGPLYLFLWDRRSGAVDLLAVYHDASWSAVSWLPGGRWLTLSVSKLPANPASSSHSPWDLYFYDLAGEGEPVILSGSPENTFPRLDHSLDGQWLVLAHNDYVELINLDFQVGSGQPYRRFLLHNAGNCREAVFVN